MTFVLLGGLALSSAAGWLTVDWWTLRRPLRAPTAQGRELRMARIEAGKPLSYICTDCGRTCRKHVHNPSFDNPLPSDMALCDTCILNYPNHDDLRQWMGFDIIRG